VFNFLNNTQDNDGVKPVRLLEKPIFELAKGKVFSIKRILRYAMAVTAILLFLVTGIGGYKFYQLSPETLYNELNIEYNLPTARGGESKAESRIERMYKEQNFADIIKEAQKKVELSDKGYLLTGMSHLQLNDLFAAIYSFKKLTENKRSWYQQDAEYYLALAYLKNRDYDHAITLMQKIRNHSGHVYRQRFSSNFIGKIKMLKWR
jgi:uncharacterized protein HemX